MKENYVRTSFFINKEMLKRINLSKPVISASRFEDDRKA